MMVRINILIVLAVTLCSKGIIAQELINLEQAVSIALQNNYNVRIARNDAVIGATNNTLGNAGLLPEVALNFGNNYNINNTRQEFFSGDKREGNHVKTSNLNANLQLAWTVFDGMRMFVNRDRLMEIENIGQLNVQLQMENTIYQVMSSYYNINQQKKRINTINKAIEISKERKALAELKQNVGTGSLTPVLQAEVDINSDSSALIRQQLILKSAKISLNEILGRNPDTEFETVDEAANTEETDYKTWVDKANQRNRMLQMADKQIRLSQLGIKQWESNKYPTIDLNLGYNFNRLEAEIGILKFNQNTGFSYGLTGRWNIFNGWNNKREIQVAKLGLETNKLLKEQSILSLETDIFVVYNQYVTSKTLASLEIGNIEVARKNLDISTEKMRIGTIDALELRQAQLNLIDAEFRKISSDFETSMAQLELKRLAGDLLK